MSRELVAKAELDRVEKILEEAGIIRNGEVNLAKLAINDASKTIDTGWWTFRKNGTRERWLIPSYTGWKYSSRFSKWGSWRKNSSKFSSWYCVICSTNTPMGRAFQVAVKAIDGLNTIASHFGYDIGSLAGEIYDWATKGDKYKDYITQDGFLRVVMDDGTVYMRPLKGRYGLATGNYMNDVLFGGDWNDTLQGGNGSDLLIGGDGFDTYNAGTLDIIRDSDGKGSVHFNGHKLTGGTYDKDRDLYISDDYIEYKLHDDGRLVVSDMGENIVIENFNKDNNDLGIILIDPKDIVVTIHDNQANEGGNGKHTLGFKVSLNRKLEAGEYLTLYINGQLVKFTENEQEKDNAYIYEWDGNESKDGDRKFEVSGSVLQSGTSKNLNVKYIHPAKGLIKDDDQDNDPDPEREASPIVIDLGNDGINSHALNYTINFDLDNNGFKEATGWVSGDDALLAIDKNNNGIIDNGSELFGNKSISDSAFSYTNSSLNNGFETLKSYDTNNDGIIDSQDAEFDKLLLWQDKNGNAITDNGELIKLSDKVSSIDLNYTNTNINNNDNTIRQTSTATLNDDTKVKADDIWFKVNYKDTEEIIDESQIPFEIKALPNVMAFGNIHSLHYAMAKNETLATMVNLYLIMDSENLKEFANLNLLVAWILNSNKSEFKFVNLINSVF